MKGTLNYIDSFIGNIFKRIENSSKLDTQSIAYFRVFMGIFMLSHYLPDWLWFGDAPQAFFSPHMFTATGLFDGFWDKNLYFLLDLSNIILFAMVTLGIKARLSFFLLFIVNFIGFSFEFSFGKIDHEVHLFLIVLLTLAFTNAGTKTALIKDKLIKSKTQQWALSLLCIYIAFGFFTAGLPKFIRWVDFDINHIGFLDWFFKGYYTYDRQLLLADSVFNTPYIVFEILDHIAPTIELLSFVFLLWSRRAWRIYLIILCFFHLGNMMLLNIEFALNITGYGLFIIAPFLSNFRRYLPKGENAKYLLIGLVSILVLYQIADEIYYWDYTYEVGYFSHKFMVDSYISVGMWLVTIAIGLYSLFNNLYVLPEDSKLR
ncbi:hypothetical protein [uncultured Maribacter sp.]|uniref:hypothetical protein n=1 Tax=uncultured Maribacter sp. TaxID=431308 RepID=UPI0030EB3A17|tara:strand:+ start:30907 stop:32028 length:1122 start_codon:yes stop_codon:yes gene_type:complete